MDVHSTPDRIRNIHFSIRICVCLLSTFSHANFAWIKNERWSEEKYHLLHCYYDTPFSVFYTIEKTLRILAHVDVTRIKITSFWYWYFSITMVKYMHVYIDKTLCKGTIFIMINFQYDRLYIFILVHVLLSLEDKWYDNDEISRHW